MEEKKDVAVPDDESTLDKELETTISAIKAGQEPPKVVEEVKPEEVKPEPKVEEKPPEVKAEESSNPPVPDSEESKYEFKLPIPGKPRGKQKFESDEVYEKRIELMDLISRKKLSKTEEQREQLSSKIQETRKEMSLLNQSAGIINPLNKVESAKPEVEDEALKADKERLKQLGGATKDDIAEIVRQERIAADTKSTLEKFVDRYPELKDTDVREVFFDFVDSNYNWNGKTGKALMTVLELARENMFRPSESIQERVLKGANVQEKINAMQFPGGALAKTGYSPEQRKEIDELKATGMSEEKALELLSE